MADWISFQNYLQPEPFQKTRKISLKKNTLESGFSVSKNDAREKKYNICGKKFNWIVPNSFPQTF